jgi:hypothetical protein
MCDSPYDTTTIDRRLELAGYLDIDVEDLTVKLGCPFDDRSTSKYWNSIAQLPDSRMPMSPLKTEFPFLKSRSV